MTQKHTPTPWSIINGRTIYRADGVRIGSLSDHQWPEIDHPESTENAKRIVACVNACEGMHDPASRIGELKVTEDQFYESERTRNEVYDIMTVLLAEVFGVTNDPGMSDVDMAKKLDEMVRGTHIIADGMSATHEGEEGIVNWDNVWEAQAIRYRAADKIIFVIDAEGYDIANGEDEE